MVALQATYRESGTRSGGTSAPPSPSWAQHASLVHSNTHSLPNSPPRPQSRHIIFLHCSLTRWTADCREAGLFLDVKANLSGCMRKRTELPRSQHTLCALSIPKSAITRFAGEWGGFAAQTTSCNTWHTAMCAFMTKVMLLPCFANLPPPWGRSSPTNAPHYRTNPLEVLSMPACLTPPLTGLIVM